MAHICRFPGVTALVLGLILAGAVDGPAPQLSAATSHHPCGWHITSFPKAAHVNGLVSISQPAHGSAWAAANRWRRDTISYDAILHWNGRGWVLVPRPEGKSRLDDVLAISSRDVWFAGQGGGGDGGLLIEHWNGRRVSVVPGPPPSAVTVEDLAGTRPGSIWLLSYSNEQTYLGHWNGSAWSPAQAPVLGEDPWQAISGRSWNDLWAVGGYPGPGGDVAHWNGSRWRYFGSPIFRGPNSSGLFGVLDLGPRDVWAVGETHAYHFDGRKWKVTPGPAPNPENWAIVPAIAGLRHGPVYAAGSSRNASGRILRWTGNRWIQVNVPLPKHRSSGFTNLTVRANGEVWAAGDSWEPHAQSRVGDRALIDHYVPCPSRRR